MMSVLEPWLPGIAASINKVAALDPEFPPRLDALEGKRLRIDVEGLAVGVDVTIESRRFHLSGENDTAPDVRIAGAPVALLGLLQADRPLDRLQSGNIHIQGDMRAAQRFSTLFGQLDIDWEELLAARLGDMPAHQLGQWARGLLRWRQRTHRAWERALGEYLQEEARHLPTRIEIENFLDQVDTLRDDAERAEARLNRLAKQRSTRKTC